MIRLILHSTSCIRSTSLQVDPKCHEHAEQQQLSTTITWSHGTLERVKHPALKAFGAGATTHGDLQTLPEGEPINRVKDSPQKKKINKVNLPIIILII